MARRLTEDDIEVGAYLLLTKERAGIVKYKGPVDYAEGTHFGVELIGSMGKHSGTVRKKHYFDCEKGRGMMVKMDRVRKLLDEKDFTEQTGSTDFAKMGLSHQTLGIEQEQEDESEEEVMDPRGWGVAEVVQYINQLLGDHGNLFAENSVDGPNLLQMKPADLRSLGLRPGTTRKVWAQMKTDFAHLGVTD